MNLTANIDKSLLVKLNKLWDTEITLSNREWATIHSTLLARKLPPEAMIAIACDLASGSEEVLSLIQTLTRMLEVQTNLTSLPNIEPVRAETKTVGDVFIATVLFRASTAPEWAQVEIFKNSNKEPFKSELEKKRLVYKELVEKTISTAKAAQDN